MDLVNFNRLDKTLVKINTDITKIVNAVGDTSFITNAFVYNKGLLNEGAFSYVGNATDGKIYFKTVNIDFKPGEKNVETVADLKYTIEISNLKAKDCARLGGARFMSFVKEYSINGKELNKIDAPTLANACTQDENILVANIHTATKDYGIVLNEQMKKRLENIKNGNKDYYANQVIEPMRGGNLSCKNPLKLKNNACQCPDGQKWTGEKCVPMLDDNVNIGANYGKYFKLKEDGSIENNFACKHGYYYSDKDKKCKAINEDIKRPETEYAQIMRKIADDTKKLHNRTTKSIATNITITPSEVFISDKEFKNGDFSTGRDDKIVYVCHKPFEWDPTLKRCENKAAEAKTNENKKNKK